MLTALAGSVPITLIDSHRSTYVALNPFITI